MFKNVFIYQNYSFTYFNFESYIPGLVFKANTVLNESLLLQSFPTFKIFIYFNSLIFFEIFYWHENEGAYTLHN